MKFGGARGPCQAQRVGFRAGEAELLFRGEGGSLFSFFFLMDEVNPGAHHTFLLLMASEKLKPSFWLPLANESDFLECIFVNQPHSLLLLFAFSMYFLVLSCFYFMSPFCFMCRTLSYICFLEHIVKESN